MTIHFAIQCEPNPGGHAFRSMLAFSEDGQVVYQNAQYLGRRPDYSNNSVAYRTLIAVLRWAAQNAAHTSVEICTDQEILTKQIPGEWECNAAHLRPLRDEARTLLQEMNVRLLYIPSRENMQARLLCRMAAHQARVDKRGGQYVA